MPSDTRAFHPSGLGLTFREDDHSYIDDFGMHYTSGTTLVHRGFKPFDAVATAEAKSKRTGIAVETYLQEWKAKCDHASILGTRMHENCEHHILGEFGKLHTPINSDEQLEFATAFQEVELIKSAGFVSLQPEKIVFSPRFKIAGSIDLLCKKSDNCYTMLDWKRVKELKFKGFNNAKGCHLATCYLNDCNFFHYSLQLSIYEQILKLEGYIPADAVVNKRLLVYNAGRFDRVDCAELAREALVMMAWNVTIDNLDEVPF